MVDTMIVSEGQKSNLLNQRQISGRANAYNTLIHTHTKMTKTKMTKHILWLIQLVIMIVMYALILTAFSKYFVQFL